MKNDKIAVLIPCYNEEQTITAVINDVHKFLPQAQIYVYDNNSTDKTAEMAAAAGATVRSENRQGKGFVVRRMFADINADIYVMVDGDATYDISAVPELINRLQHQHLDMVVGARQETQDECYRRGHRWGNWALTALVKLFFHQHLQDMLSGLRVFSKRFVKNFPAQSHGFETETELTIFALSEHLPMAEVSTNYFARPQGSVSKLSTYRDGLRILKTIIFLIKEERPLLFFWAISLCLCAAAFLLFIPIAIEFYNFGTVSKFPTAILITGLIICAVLSFFAGCILDSIKNLKKEIRRRDYLQDQ